MTLHPQPNPPTTVAGDTTRTTGAPMDGEHMSKYRDTKHMCSPLFGDPRPAR